MNKTIKGIIYLIPGLIGIFTLGAYTFALMHNIKPVPTSDWIMTGGFSLFFIAQAIYIFKNPEN